LESFVASAARFPITTLGILLCAALTLPAFAAEGAIGSQRPSNLRYILVGFAGGFVRHNNPHHGPVQLAERLQQEAPKGTYVQVFENRRRKSAYKIILNLLDSNHNGILTENEKAQARVILFGHSWGASAVVLLARELEKIGVPVLLTVQVDSVAKFWQRDGVIPDNVEAAANFYQPHGLVHGRSEIKAENGAKTQILGNYRFDYRENPVRCEGSSWFDRTFTPSHMQSQCDPQIWNRVEELVRDRIMPSGADLASVQGQ
jgi:pimeloyl-ACP methyl ester carboxylesterase